MTLSIVFGEWSFPFQRDINILDRAIEIFERLDELDIPELVTKLSKGEVIILDKEEAVCPVCGFEFESSKTKRVQETRKLVFIARI